MLSLCIPIKIAGSLGSLSLSLSNFIKVLYLLKHPILKRGILFWGYPLCLKNYMILKLLLDLYWYIYENYIFPSFPIAWLAYYGWRRQNLFWLLSLSRKHITSRILGKDLLEAIRATWNFLDVMYSSSRTFFSKVA